MKTEKNRIKAVIFDIGGVLLLPKNQKSQPKHLLNSFKGTLYLSDIVDLSNKKLVGKITKIYKKSAVGRISRKETLRLFSKELNIEEKKIDKSFYDLYMKNSRENSPLINLAFKLKKKNYKLGIVSDQWKLSEKALVFRKSFSFFDSKVISSMDGVEKPAQGPFILILRKLKIKPDEAIFIDDMKRNIRTAKKLGMKMILFRNNKKFFKEMEKFNL